MLSTDSMARSLSVFAWARTGRRAAQVAIDSRGRATLFARWPALWRVILLVCCHRHELNAATPIFTAARATQHECARFDVAVQNVDFDLFARHRLVCVWQWLSAVRHVIRCCFACNFEFV